MPPAGSSVALTLFRDRRAKRKMLGKKTGAAKEVPGGNENYDSVLRNGSP